MCNTRGAKEQSEIILLNLISSIPSTESLRYGTTNHSNTDSSLKCIVITGVTSPLRIPVRVYYLCPYLQVILPLPVVMVLVAIFLVFVPIIGEPMDAAIAVGLILPAIPVYFIFVYKYKHRPKIFTRINGTYIRMCTYVCKR